MVEFKNNRIILTAICARMGDKVLLNYCTRFAARLRSHLPAIISRRRGLFSYLRRSTTRRLQVLHSPHLHMVWIIKRLSDKRVRRKLRVVLTVPPAGFEPATLRLKVGGSGPD